jgi:putative transposase
MSLLQDKSSHCHREIGLLNLWRIRARLRRGAALRGAHAPSTKVREVAAMLKAIHASEDVAAAREKALQVIEKLRALSLTKAAELAEAAVGETLTYYTFPEEHWRRVRTDNPLERILREIRRRTRWSAHFRTDNALNLAAARLRHVAGTAWSSKRYLNMELLKDQQMRGVITA